MARRNRLTWRERQASPPPATPGYGTDEHSHPADQPDPGAHDYENGDTSSWNEDPHPGPYTQSSPPATPGYGTEDGDHPAEKRGSVKDIVYKRAAKALRMASAILGSKATKASVDVKALDLMSLDDFVFDATYQRVAEHGRDAGDFLACGDDAMGMDDEFMGMDDEDDEEDAMLAQMLDGEGGDDLYGMNDGINAFDDGMDDGMDDALMGMDDGMEEDVMGMDDMFSMFPRAAAMKLGFDANGFAQKSDWKGKKSVFATLDTDADGIISITELTASLFEDEDEAFSDLDEEEMAMLASMEADAKAPIVLSNDASLTIEAADDDDDDKSDDEDSDKEASDDGGDDDKSDDEDDDEDEGKEASDDSDDMASIFSMTSDPMGLSQTASEIEEDAILNEILSGKSAADDDEDDEDSSEEEEEEEDDKEAKKKASRTASQRPRPRKKGRGPATLGSVSRKASTGGGEIDDLSKLWESAPDVSEIF